MIKWVKDKADAKTLSFGEQLDINNKIDFEIVKSHHNMLKLGAVANIVGGALYVLLMFRLMEKTDPQYLYIWYLILFLTNSLNIVWSLRYEGNITPERLHTWRKVFLYILAAICLAWGSIGIIFLTGTIQYQLITLTFLLAVLICFTFSSVTDFTVGLISILCLLVPTIVYRGFLGIYGIYLQKPDVIILNLGVSACFMVLGAFMIVADYFGYLVIRKYFQLSLENIILSDKLAKINLTLEQKVKDRTIELEKSLQLVKYQATHDLLTDLPNQRLLLEYLSKAIDDSVQNKRMFALACVTLNEMEKIIEALGQRTAELILRQVSQRFHNITQNNVSIPEESFPYTVAISRQDSFIVLIYPVQEILEIEAKVQRIFALLNDPVMVLDQTIQLTASIGVSIYPKDGLEVNTLLMHMDSAAMKARLHGGNHLYVYEASIDTDLTRKFQIETQLHGALRNKEFELVYQPFVDADSGSVCGMEALIRWKNEVLGTVSPMEFIPISEANGTIIAIGEWALRTACKQTAVFHAKGYNTLQVSVNLSAKQLLQKNIVQVIKIALLEAKLKPEFLKLELTESKAFRDDVIPIINEITNMGVSLSIDDFGTGYSAFSNLKLFRISQIKIDKSFIDDLVTNKDSRAIVLNTITLGKKMNIKVLAEGVETREQLDILRELGCDQIQGYYFSKPLAADDFTKFLKSTSKGAFRELFQLNHQSKS